MYLISKSLHEFLRKITQMGRKIRLYKTGIKTCLHIFLLVFETYVFLYQICILLFYFMKFKKRIKWQYMTGEKMSAHFFIFIFRIGSRRNDNRKERTSPLYSLPKSSKNNSCSETQLLSSFLKDLFVLFLSMYMHMCICHMYVRQMCICYMCVCHMCVYATCVKVSMVIRKGHQMPRTWGYRWLWTNCVWVLAVKLRSFTRSSQKAVLTSETSITSHFTPWLFKIRNLSLILNLTAFPYCLQTLK